MRVTSKFAERLSELVALSALTNNKIGESVGVKGSTISLWTEGRHMVQLSNAVSLCRFFNCSLEFLMGRSDTVLDYAPHPAPPFYERLRFVMQERGVSRYRLCNDLHTSHASFADWKTGGDIVMTTVIAFADYLDVTLDYLVGLDR